MQEFGVSFKHIINLVTCRCVWPRPLQVCSLGVTCGCHLWVSPGCLCLYFLTVCQCSGVRLGLTCRSDSSRCRDAGGGGRPRRCDRAGRPGAR